MIRMRPVEFYAEKYLRNSVRAYLQGEHGCNLRWIEGILRSNSDSAQTRSILATHFAQYASTQRYSDLMARL